MVIAKKNNKKYQIKKYQNKVEKNNDNKLVKKTIKNSYRPRVRVRGNNDKNEFYIPNKIY